MESERTAKILTESPPKEKHMESLSQYTKTLLNEV